VSIFEKIGNKNPKSAIQLPLADKCLNKGQVTQDREFTEFYAKFYATYCLNIWIDLNPNY